MPYQFNPERYVDVRAAIGLDVDINDLPDDTLALPIYTGRTERYINDALSGLTEPQLTENKDDIDIAAAYYLASLVVPTVRAVISENVVGGFIKYAQVDLNALAEDLRGRASSMIGEILQIVGVAPDISSADVTVFTVARARRTW